MAIFPDPVVMLWSC